LCPAGITTIRLNVVNGKLKVMSPRILIVCAVMLAAAGALLFAAFRAPDESGSGARPVTEAPELPSPSQAKSRPRAERPLTIDPPGPAPKGMVWVPGGTFQMGSGDRPETALPHEQTDETPIHEVAIDGFWMDAKEVTNAQYQEFVDATGYVTIAEKDLEREHFIGQVPDVSVIKDEDLLAGSICFNPGFDPSHINKRDPNWIYASRIWKIVRGADWRHPEGPESSIENRMDHPVVHVSWDDAVAYCRWAEKQLPTEAQWEYAARGAVAGWRYPWGNEIRPDGKPMQNIWQGEFPHKNKGEDGFLTTSPVGSFKPNAFGLYDVTGNVWEWCADYYRPDYYANSPHRNPPGPAESFDPQEPGIEKRIQRGGSFMCSDNYCRGYRVSARMKGAPDTGTFHAGFRCVLIPDTRANMDQSTAVPSKDAAR
jgi:formylglycine-generating enzyme required for sulfatase activity